MLHARGRCLSLQSVLCLAVAVFIISIAGTANAANSVVVESKSFAPGQTACSVGVFVRNDVPIQGIVLPLELRSTLGPGYLSVPTTSSFRFRLVPGNRIGQSPLGMEGTNWPAPVVVSSYFSKPCDENDPWFNECSGPISGSYCEASASADGLSPDAVLYVAVATGDPAIGEEWLVPPGEDPDGTGNASFVFVFNVTEETGCIRIDTCCKTPSTHLALVSYDDYADIEFDPGIINIGDVVCPGVTDPEVNHPPVAICKDSVVFELMDGCTQIVSASDVDNGSWDEEDGQNLHYLLSPSGSFGIGSTAVTLTVCDQDGECTSCPSVVTIRDVSEQAIIIERDSLYFRMTGDYQNDPTCELIAVSTIGCNQTLKIESQTGYLTEASWHGSELRVCADRILANNGPNGTYVEEIVLAQALGPLRDTIRAVIDVDHPPVAPGCDSVCGFLLRESGRPYVRARVMARTCDPSGVNCTTIPDVWTYTDSTGAFCLNTNGWPRVDIFAFSWQFAKSISKNSDCDGLPVYMYIEYSPYHSGPGTYEPCLTHGFVLDGAAGSPRLQPGAQLELWDSYADGTLILQDTADSFGHFGAWDMDGDLVVNAPGFCTTVLRDVQCSYEPLIVQLDSIPFSEFPAWPYFAGYHSTNATLAGVPILPGDAIYATDPQGVICGATWVEDAGSFSIRVLGDDPNTATDEGAVPGDLITLWLNCDYVVASPVAWENAGSYQFDLAWSTESEVAIDILPGVCPNVIDTGVTQLPSPVRPEPAGGAPTEEPSIEVAILGTASLDAPNVDLASVQFEGLSPLSHQLADVSRPPSLETQSDCACPETGSDGLVDLVLKFDQRELLDALGELHDGEVRALTFAGNTKRGRTLSGTNCLTVKFGPTRVDPRSGRGLPGKSRLATYPNPFNAETMVSFSLEAESQVRVDVFNVLGNRVATLVDDVLPAGEHRAAWNAAGMASGMYFVRLATAQGQVTKKVVLVR